MAYTTIVLVFLLFLPKAFALQATTVQNNVLSHQSLADDTSRTFISANKLWCGQAPTHIAKNALSLYKSMPRGKLYEGMSVNDAGSCEQLGYTLSTGEDPCYPGLQTFHRNEEDKKKFQHEIETVLIEYGEITLDLEDVSLIDSCQCKDGSFARNFRGDSCKQVVPLLSLHQENYLGAFVSANKMWCAQGKKDIAHAALDLYKSMPRAKLYAGIWLGNDTRCKHLGYGWSTGEDPCYPGLYTFYRSEKEEKEFSDAYHNALKEFGESHRKTFREASLMDACMCKKDSFALSARGNSCDKAPELVDSIGPIRTFVSTHKLWCGQAHERVANEALQLFKSMPRSKLYDGTLLTNDASCELLGYTWSAGEDPCVPGLQTFYRNPGEEKKFLKHYEKTLTEFGENYNFSFTSAVLMESCKCKDDSVAKNSRTSSCDQVVSLQESIDYVETFEIRRSVTRSFVSVNRLWCAQAPTRVAEGALALFKAMPRGRLFDKSLVHVNDTQSCQQRGYQLNAGEDPCYPGLLTFYRNEDEKNEYKKQFQVTIQDYGDRYNLTSDNVNLMDSCTCHVDSHALKYRGRSCDLLKQIEASWVHREPNTGKELACAGGPFALSTRALAVLKSTEQLPMHQTDQIAPLECDKLGFPFRPPQENDCFTGLRFWTATRNSSTDVLNLQTIAALDNLIDGGYKNFTNMFGIDMAVHEPSPSCNCAPDSAWGKNEKAKRSCHFLSARSQIRDWWKE